MFGLKTGIIKRFITYANINGIKDFTLPNQQIQYGKFPSCVDCMYFNAPNDYIERGYCLKYGKKNVVTGVISYNEAYTHRMTTTSTCTIKGDGFVKKEQPEYNGCP